MKILITILGLMSASLTALADAGNSNCIDSLGLNNRTIVMKFNGSPNNIWNGISRYTASLSFDISKDGFVLKSNWRLDHTLEVNLVQSTIKDTLDYVPVDPMVDRKDTLDCHKESEATSCHNSIYDYTQELQTIKNRLVNGTNEEVNALYCAMSLLKQMKIAQSAGIHKRKH